MFIPFIPVWERALTDPDRPCQADKHPPISITWLWTLYWCKPAGWKPSAGKIWNGAYVRLPLVGALELRWQKAMPANASLSGLPLGKD